MGAIDIRHYLNELLVEFGGHIGYSVRPSQRGTATATWALQTALPIARDLDLKRVLLPCDPNNEASRKTIERNGGFSRAPNKLPSASSSVTGSISDESRLIGRIRNTEHAALFIDGLHHAQWVSGLALLVAAAIITALLVRPTSG